MQQRTKAKEGDLVFLIIQQQLMKNLLKEVKEKILNLTLGKDLFLKGFDKQLIGVKKDDEK